MSSYFPSPKDVVLCDGVKGRVFQLGDSAGTTIIVAQMAPGAAIPSHTHDEHQIGLCIHGTFKIEVQGRFQELKALQTAYFARTGIQHSAINDSTDKAVTIDIKRRPTTDDDQLTHSPPDIVFMEQSHAKTIKGGLDASFFIGPWFEIMLSRLSPGATMPRHSHRSIQIGVGVDGVCTMQIAEESQRFGPYDVYFAPEYIPHSGWNAGQVEAFSLNVFIPPRWNLLPKKLRSKGTNRST